ncbi:hypothetical protein AAKU55_005597 [Oxalobacteraceae bacterium GrIS 1.11]
MEKLTFFLFATVLYASTSARESLELTPQAITKNIEKNGAKATVGALSSGTHGHQWEAVLRKIKTGDARWLAVAGVLAEGTDAGTAEDLQVSLAVALPKNPGGVLLLADTKSFLSLENICGAPFIEPTHAYIKRYLAEAQHSLENLKDVKVEQQKVKCLAKIQDAILQISNEPAQGAGKISP